MLVALLVVGALIHDYVLGPRLQRELRAATRGARDATPLVVVGWFNFALTLAVPILGASSARLSAHRYIVTCDRDGNG